jgi:transposase
LVADPRLELFGAIRRDARRGESIRELAERYGVHRRTVRQAMDSAMPAPRKKPVRNSPRLDAVKPWIDEMLRVDLTAPRKQRHTVRRIVSRLIEEHGATDLPYTTVRDYVGPRRRHIAAEAGKGSEQGFILQTYEPGQEAEVDFGELYVVLAGVKTKVFLFALRMSYSGKSVHQVFASQGLEAFVEGHLHAFAVLGGVPAGKIRYDNLKPAVSRVLGGRARTESDQWVWFRSHVGFEAFYCKPGIAGAHEKGGVEGEIGRFRRNHLVPVSEVDTLAELNARIDVVDIAEDARRIEGRVRTIGADFATEAPLLRPLPGERFEPGRMLTPRVDRYSCVTVRQCYYSVPARLIGKQVRVLLRASEVIVFDGRVEVARHVRAITKWSRIMVLDHYLEVLLRKPGAFAGATALVQARKAGVFTVAHEAFWSAARSAHGDSTGTQALIEVLLLHRHLPAADVIAGITIALAAGASTCDVVAMEARTAGRLRRDADTEAEPLPGSARVISLTERRLTGPVLPPDQRPLPSVAAYDQLLPRRAAQNRAPPHASPSQGEVS